MENLFPLPGFLQKAYKEKFVEGENWSRTNLDGFDFFANVKITSDFDYVDRAMSYIKKHSPEKLVRIDGTKKSKIKSISTREKANEFFKKKEWFEALKLYSKSVSLADNGSTELGFAYANRSALLLHRGFYKECLEDIERALQLDYPQDKKPQLITRQEKAKELLPGQKKTVVKDLLPSLPSANHVLRGATDAVKLSESKEYGRFVEATRDILPGDIILVEDPYVLIVTQEYKTTHCGDCGQLCFNPVPCKKCCVEMYCNEKCRENAYNTYHQYECIVTNFYPKGIYDIVNVPSENGNESEMNKELIRQLSLRITLKGFRNYQDSCVDDPEDLYEEIGKLQTHKQDLNKSSLMILAFNCAKQFHILKRHTSYFSKFHFKDKEDILKYHLLRNRLICCFNLGSILYRLDEPINSNSNTTLGIGLYPTYSMFNHACVENVGYGYFGKTMVMRAIRTIKKGEQCFTNYGYFFQDHPKIVRHIQMQSNYLFLCKCDACKHDWPIANLPELLKGGPDPECQTLMKLELLRAVWMQEKYPNEDLRKEMFNACAAAEHRINLEGPNVNVILYYNLASMVTLARFQGGDF